MNTSFSKLKALGLFLSGAILLIGLRFVFMSSDHATHLHANFAVFLDGERLDLTDDRYMEDVEGCKPSFVALQPEERVHMHNNEDVVAHIHDEGVTWGHFFSNIGFTLSDSAFVNDEGVIYTQNGNKSLKFVLNGQQVDSVANRLMGTEDQLLISYGSESLDEILQSQFAQVEDNASYHNEHPDPGSCSGEIELDWWTKLKKAIL